MNTPTPDDIASRGRELGSRPIDPRRAVQLMETLYEVDGAYWIGSLYGINLVDIAAEEDDDSEFWWLIKEDQD